MNSPSSLKLSAGWNPYSHCMGVCLKSLFEVTNDISSMIYKKHGWNPIGFLSKAVCIFNLLDQV